MKKNLKRCLLLAVTATAALAHGGAEHVTGFLRAVSPGSVSVETLKHETVIVLLTAKTEVMKGKAKAAPGDLKVGDRAVVHVTKNKDGKLEAVEIEFSSPAPAPKKK